MAVELDPVLAEVLACPAPDHGALRAGTPQDPDADVLACTVCGRMYPVVDGIPVMLLDEAVLPGDGAAGRATENGELPT
ncbi:Trm112 family protein [Tomitella gaofuii]|uniref:Trm112 family protein n=1 Tax=Tomitella gaofuii TaxID=2760083 RepID=UPI0015FB77FB|nr:Trm112 family protein [Tomitella gaofuii]